MQSRGQCRERVRYKSLLGKSLARSSKLPCGHVPACQTAVLALFVHVEIRCMCSLGQGWVCESREGEDWNERGQVNARQKTRFCPGRLAPPIFMRTKSGGRLSKLSTGFPGRLRIRTVLETSFCLFVVCCPFFFLAHPNDSAELEVGLSVAWYWLRPIHNDFE
jgi:hypothetical protein